MKISTNIKIVLLFFVRIAVLIWGFNFLKGKNLLSKSTNYFIVYDKIGGLKKSSIVTINGFKVGQVIDINFLSDNSGKLVVNFIMENDIKIPKNSTARIYSMDLMGSKAISLIFSDSASIAISGDTLLSDIEKELKEEVNAQMLPLKYKAEGLMGSIDSVLVVIQNIFTENTRENLEQTFANINTTIYNLEKTSLNLNKFVDVEKGKVSKIFANIHSVTTMFSSSSGELKHIISNFSDISDTLAAIKFATTINNANNTLQNINSVISDINNGKGSIGQLINDDKLYKNLENSSKQLDLLLKDIRTNPKRYIHYSLFDFGKTNVIDEEGNVIKKTKNKKKNSKKEEDNDLSYKIQISSSKNKVALNSRFFKGLKNIERYKYDGVYKYTIGNSQNFNKIHALCDSIRNYYPDAFIVATKNGKRVKFKGSTKVKS